jgi:hypothetical protein
MSFQSTIYSTQALGKQGTVSRLNPLVKIPVVAEGNAVVAGGFVLEGTNPETQVIGLSASTSSATAVAGVAVFEKMQPAINGLNGLNGVQLNEGEELAKVIKGYVYVKPTTASVHGQVVGVDPATGEIQTANDAASLASGFIDTGWKVETGAAAGQVCEIFNI